MKNKLFKPIILIIIFVLIIIAAYYLILNSNLLVKEKDVKLYFATSDAMYLDTEDRTVKGRNIYLETVNALITGPITSDLTKTIPDGVEVLNISKKSDTIQVDFSEEIVSNHWGGSSGEILTVYSIVNTLTQFEDINRVEILIEGKEVETLVGHMDLSVPIESNQDIIK